MNSSDGLAVALRNIVTVKTASISASSSVFVRKMTLIWRIDPELTGGSEGLNGGQKLAAVARKKRYILVSGKQVRAPGAKKRGRKPKAVVVER